MGARIRAGKSHRRTDRKVEPLPDHRVEATSLLLAALHNNTNTQHAQRLAAKTHEEALQASHVILTKKPMHETARSHLPPPCTFCVNKSFPLPRIDCSKTSLRIAIFGLREGDRLELLVYSLHQQPIFPAVSAFSLLCIRRRGGRAVQRKACSSIDWQCKQVGGRPGWRRGEARVSDRKNSDTSHTCTCVSPPRRIEMMSCK